MHIILLPLNTVDGVCPTCGFNEYCGCETDFECRCNDELVGGVCAGSYMVCSQLRLIMYYYVCTFQ